VGTAQRRSDEAGFRSGGGSGPIVNPTTTVVAAAHNEQLQTFFIFLRPIPICIASRLEPDHSLRKVGIGPVGVRPFDKRELPP
jgi:hypothetical protein